MCGFVVVFDPRGGIKRDDEDIHAAGQLLNHRGKDDAGSYFDDHVGIHFQRLSIIDLSRTGRQPFTSSDGTKVLVFNGEIYNYRQIRRDLISKGVHFNSSSDTEVLLRSIEEYGFDCVNKFRGMFSFVLWDSKQQQLTLARDRFGIKPLYFYNDHGRYVVASEIKSILHYSPNSRDLNEASIYKFITRNFTDDSEDTFFRNIRKVPPATLMNISANGVSQHQYWHLSQSKNNSFDPDAFRDTFDETIRLHMLSDVPVAATLSGGMDSGSIVSTACRIGDSNSLKAFSVVPPDTPDESYWIDKTVAYSGVTHHYTSLDLTNMADIVDRIILSHDEPFQYSSCIYQYMLREQLAENNVKVLLVGEGADEVLAGYKRIIFTYLSSLYHVGRIDEFLEVLQQSNSLFPKLDVTDIIDSLRKYIDVTTNNRTGQENTTGFSMTSTAANEQYRELGSEPIYINHTEHTENTFFDLLKKHLYVRNLPFVLRMEDRNSMAHGIEARVPFLDHVFVEMVFAHNFYEFMRGGQNKSMLRRAMDGFMPPAILSRKEKFNRPGNNANLVYSLLRERVMEQLQRTDADRLPFWTKNLYKSFLKDSQTQNVQKADAWLRIYVTERWRELYFT